MATLTTIRTRYDNTKCRVCKASIPYNGLCRYSSRIKGVACLVCEPERQATPANGSPVVTPELTAALADGQALRTRIGEMDARIVELTAECHQLRQWMISTANECGTLRSNLATSEQVRLAQAAHILQLTAPSAPAEIDDGPDLIDVMAPGGVERWLEHDLAQIAAEKAAAQLTQGGLIEAANNALALDDDCPI